MLREKKKFKIRLRDKDVLQTIGDYYALGMDYPFIADKLNEEYGLKVTPHTIGNIMKSFSIRKKEILHSDKAMAEVYKSALYKIKDEVYKNINILNDIRDYIKGKYEDIKKDAPSNKLFQYTREITNMIKTQNDTLRTMSDYLKRLEIETTEVKLNVAKSVQETISKLKELENQGYIKIDNSFYNNNPYGQEMSQEIEKSNEVK